MTEMDNDTEFRKVLEGLDYSQQRGVAARFVGDVLALSSDDRVLRVIKVASDATATTDELSGALKTARAATVDSHTRCGSEGDWKEQAGYFVARAAAAAVTPEGKGKAGGPAWQAALSCRMARTSMLIDSGSVADEDESARQYRILSEFLQLQ